MQEEELSSSSSTPILPSIASSCHCLLCGGIKTEGVIKVEVDGGEEADLAALELGNEEKLRCFVNLFGPQLNLKEFENEFVNEVLFCEECSVHLSLVVELKKQLDEIEGNLKEKLEKGDEVAGTCDTLEKEDFRKKRKLIFDQENADPSPNQMVIPIKKSSRARRKTVRNRHVKPPRKKKVPVVSTSSKVEIEGEESLLDFSIPDSNEELPPQKLVDEYEENPSPAPSPPPLWEDEDEPPSPPPPPKKKRKTKREKEEEEDFIPPPSDAEDGGDDDDISDSDPEWSTTLKNTKQIRPRVNPITGSITYFKTTLEKLGDDGSSYKCSACDHVLPYNRPLMKAHVVKFHTELYECSLCNRRFGSNASLRQHILRHNPNKPKVVVATCQICAKPMLNTGHIRNHLWSHYSEQERLDAVAAGEKPPPQYDKSFQCDQCARSFNSKWFLNDHQKRIHVSQDERTKVLCPICGVSVLGIKDHLKRVHGEGQGPNGGKRFICSFCDKRFYNDGQLRKHKAHMHTEERIWKCEMCPKDFATKRQLREHVKCHLNIRPFQCAFCSAAFTKKHHMTRHVDNYHTEGCTPGRPSYVRGPEVKVKGKKEGS